MLSVKKWNLISVHVYASACACVHACAGMCM